MHDPPGNGKRDKRSDQHELDKILRQQTGDPHYARTQHFSYANLLGSSFGRIGAYIGYETSSGRLTIIEITV